jgi:hypothetical protein
MFTQPWLLGSYVLLYEKDILPQCPVGKAEIQVHKSLYK